MSSEISQALPGDGAAARAQRRAFGQVLGTVFLNFITYFSIGLPLATFPAFVHVDLGYGALLAGLVISAQYAATLVTRAPVGLISDRYGPKIAVLTGFGFAVLSGLCILAAAWSAHAAPLVPLAFLLLSRLCLGAAESGTGTGCIAWGIGQVGESRTAQVMSWNGVASYGGIALGAPAGVVLDHAGGIGALGAVACLLALFGLALALWRKATPVVGGVRMKLRLVIGHVLPFGLGMALASVGFGTIVTFVSLYFASRHWQGAAYALTAFGLAFIFVRIAFSNLIGRQGGFRVAIASFGIELIGLLVLWQAPSAALADLGILITGLGLSLIFPALAVEALHRVPLSSRGGGIAAYTVFLDLSLGGTGPLAGAVIGRFGYDAVYLLAAIAVTAGLLLTIRLRMGPGRNGPGRNGADRNGADRNGADRNGADRGGAVRT